MTDGPKLLSNESAFLLQEENDPESTPVPLNPAQTREVKDEGDERHSSDSGGYMVMLGGVFVAVLCIIAVLTLLRKRRRDREEQGLADLEARRQAIMLTLAARTLAAFDGDHVRAYDDAMRMHQEASRDHNPLEATPMIPVDPPPKVCFFSCMWHSSHAHACVVQSSLPYLCTASVFLYGAGLGDETGLHTPKKGAQVPNKYT